MRARTELGVWWNSIGYRLTVLLAAIAALLSFLSWSMVTSFAREAAERTQDNVLAASATAIAEALHSDGGAIRLELPYSAFAMLDSTGEDRVFYRVATAEGTLTGYDDLTPPRRPAAPGQVTVDTMPYRDTTVRVVTVTRTVLAAQEPVPVSVSVAQTRSGLDAIATGLSRTAAALSVAFFLLAIGLGAVAARSSIRPLNDFAQAVARRGPSDLRPLQRRVPVELAPLQIALNRLMDRLGQSIRRSEEFIAEAAHRVRTPLATVRMQAELALHTVEKDAEKQMLRRVIRAVDESSRSAGQLLDHAMVSFRADALARDPIDLADLAARVTEALRPTADMKDIEIRLSADHPARVHGDAVLLESALRNVLDNSVKYSPAETLVRVSLAGDGREWQIMVSDEGRGFDGDPLPALTQRFRRGRNADNVVGSGLGLTIAEDALRAHGGRLELSTPKTGTGACVSLVLPAS